MNQDLKYLAKTVSEWGSVLGLSHIVKSGAKVEYVAGKCVDPDLIYRQRGHRVSRAFTHAEWQAARDELAKERTEYIVGVSRKAMAGVIDSLSPATDPFSNEDEDEAWDELERRMDTIGQNGNGAEHYESPSRTAEQFLAQASELMTERGEQYDGPQGERSISKTIAAFNSITGRDLTESEGWLMMSVFKRVRQYNGGYHKDSAEDAVAYAALEAESLEHGR